jgi:hypothetical protein
VSSSVKIGSQQFHYSTINQVVGKCAQLEGCAVIVDACFLNGLILENELVFEKYVRELIVIGDSVNSVLSSLKNKELLLVAASDLKEAIQIAILAEDLSKQFVCISKESEEEFKNIVELIVV